MERDMADAFKELYEEIDRLYYVRASDVNISEIYNKSLIKTEDVPNLEDIDELIEYSKKFVQKTSNEIDIAETKQLQEHGVQCVRDSKMINKKLNTPPKWINDKKEKTSKGQTTAIRIIKRIPKQAQRDVAVNVKLQREDTQLNNQRPLCQLKKVRNIGTNVNFINTKIGKPQNNIVPVTASTTTTTTTVSKQIDRSIAKSRNSSTQGGVSNVSTTSPVIKRPAASQSTGKIYRFYSSKLSPAQLWDQQHPELAYESSQNSIFPRRMKKDDQKTKPNEKIVVPEKKEVKIVHFTDGKNIEPDVENSGIRTIEKQHEENGSAEEPFAVTSESIKTPTISKHIIPPISIQGDWKASLQVQETCRINILDKKISTEASNDSSNLKYLEIRYGMESKEIPPTPVKPSDVANTNADCEDTPQLHVTDKVFDVPNIEVKHDETFSIPGVNKYLLPFMSLSKQNMSPHQKLLVDLTDDESSSDESLENIILKSDFSEANSIDDIENFKFKHGTPEKIARTESHMNNSSRIIENLSSIPLLTSPTNFQHPKALQTPSRSVQLQVPSPPCRLQSPPRDSPPVVTAEDDDTMSPPNYNGSSKFLNNLRIWKSAIEVQSANMKLGNELTENLDVLKQNMEIIAGETQNISKITRDCETNLKQIETLKERYKKNQGNTSPAGSSRHVDQFVQVSEMSQHDCSCFGCKPIIDSIDYVPPGNVEYNHKNFQRTVLQHNPKYLKTITKICKEGLNETYKKSSSTPRAVAEKAAQKFLDSYYRSSSRISFSGIVTSDAPISRSHSPGSVRSYHTDSSNEFYSDSEISQNSRWDGKNRNSGDNSSQSESTVSSDLEILFPRQLTLSSSGSLPDNFTTTNLNKTMNYSTDEGEVLSQGEIK